MSALSAQVFPVANGYAPDDDQGSRLARVTVQLGAGVQGQLNLFDVVAAEQIDKLQTIFIDNSTGANAVTLQSSVIAIPYAIPAGCYALLPWWQTQGDSLMLIQRADAGTVRLAFFNVPMPAIIWDADGSFLSQAVTIANGADVALGNTGDAAVIDPTAAATAIALLKGNLSLQRATVGTLTTVTGTGVSISVLAANANRKGASINNLSGVTVSLRLQAAAASAANATVTLAAGQYYEVPFGYTGEIRGLWTAGDVAVTEFA